MYCRYTSSLQCCMFGCRRIQSQYDHLDKEYREHALGALLSANTRGSGKVSLINYKFNLLSRLLYSRNNIHVCFNKFNIIVEIKDELCRMSWSFRCFVYCLADGSPCILNIKYLNLLKILIESFIVKILNLICTKECVYKLNMYFRQIWKCPKIPFGFFYIIDKVN